MTGLPTPDIFDLYHIAKKGHRDSRMKGEESHGMLALAGGCLVVMGASMLWKAFHKERGQIR